MKRLVSFSLVLGVAALIAGPAAAQVGKGLSGPHYNLNIIGVPKDKHADMTGSDRHTLFVPLNTAGKVDGRVQIYFVAGAEFNVIDGNATDGSATVEVPHGDPGTVCYDVFATALGTPGGRAHVDANVIWDETDGAVLLTLDQVSFDAARGNGKPVRMDISDIFQVSGCIDMNASLTCDAGDQFFRNEWVFNVPELMSYWWDYTNTGLKLLQVRFYECSTTAPTGNVRLTPGSAPVTPERVTTWGGIKTMHN